MVKGSDNECSKSVVMVLTTVHYNLYNIMGTQKLSVSMLIQCWATCMGTKILDFNKEDKIFRILLLVDVVVVQFRTLHFKNSR